MRLIRWSTLVAVAAALAATPAQARVLQVPIAVDGAMSDWAPVLTSIDNYVSDLSEEQGDPDVPGSNDRDLRAFAVTWDATRVYFYMRRTFSANNSITFLVYVDRDHDNDLDGNDRILRYDFNGATASNREMFVYVPAGAADPVTGDGVDEPGDNGALIAATMGSAATANGLEIEASITWASLGVPAGTPLRFHAACSTGMNLPGQVNDNVAVLDGAYSVVTLVQERIAATASPGVVRLAHTLTSGGNGSERIDMSASSQQGWALALWSDPNGDGDPADGVLLASDGNGDGDFGDPVDTPPGPAADGDYNGLPDSGLLAPGGTYRFVVQVTVPAGVANGTEDGVDVLARSARDLGAVARNGDRLVVGPTTLAPDREQSGPPGGTLNAPHMACNFGGGADVIDLTVSATLGWSVALWSDPDGNGDPADGAALIDSDSDGLVDTGSLASGTCLFLLARVTIPGGASIGTRNVTTVSAASSQGFGSDLATDGLTAAQQVRLDPDRTIDVLPGDVVYGARTAVSNHSSSDTLDMTGSATQGSIVNFRSDPNCDGFGDDGGPTTVAGPLAPAGGSQCLLSEVRLPYGLAAGTVEVATSRARSQAVPAATDTALDTLRVVHIRTYANALRTVHASSFYRCNTVYAGAGGLAPGDDYRFVWADANAGDGNERVSGTYSADDLGESDDRYVLPLNKPTGAWTVTVQHKQGSSWVDVAPLGSFTFNVTDGSGSTGVIDYLATDRLNYAVSGDTLRVRAEVYNSSDIYFWRDTRFDYVVFRDLNDSGQPDAGETYVRADGTTAAWAAGLTTHTRSAVTVYPYARVFDAWQVTSVQFGTAAVWSVYMAWNSACISPIDQRVLDFSVGCAIQPAADAGPDRSFCPGGSASIGTAAQPRRTYSWSPPLGLSDAGIAQPTASPAATTTYTVTVTDIDTGCTRADSVLVTVFTPPSPNVTPDGPAVCAGASVTLDAGAGYASYLWSTGGTTRTITVSPAATTLYSVTVTDGNGCPASASETVTVNPLPVPDVTPDAPELCEGGSVTLDAGAGFATYAWSTGESTRTITVTPAVTATYSVTVTSASGCQATALETVTVDANPVPDVTPDAPAICNGASITLDAGAGYASYLWSTGATTRTITVSPAATTVYSVTVTDGNGCQGTTSETVTVNANPTPDVTPDAPGICSGNSITLDAGAGYASYLWSTGATTRTITVSPAATTLYSVTVTDGNGCQGTTSETVTVNTNPTPDVTPDAPAICNGASITLDAGAGYASYLWSTGATTRTITVSPAATTMYSVTVTDGNGCQGTTSETVTVNTNPTPDVTPDAPAICNGASITLDAGAGYASYLWSTGATTRTITVSPAATTLYSVTVTDGNGCQGTTSETVTVNANPTPDVTPDAPAICSGNSITLDAGAGYASYLWSTGATTRTITVSPAATTSYSVTVTDGNGCQGTTSEMVTVNANPVPDVTPDAPAICSGNSITLDAGAGYASYLWSTGATTRTITVSPAATTVYSVTVTDGNGCQGTTSETVTVNANPVPDVTPDAPAICSGNSITLDAGAGYASYLWSTGATTRTITVSPAATTLYSVTVTDGNVCQGTASETVTVNANPVPDPTPDQAEICAGGNAVIDAGPGYAAYAWSTGETTRSIAVSPAATTTYSVTVTDDNGCQGTGTETITVHDNPVPDVTPDAPAICAGEVLTLDAGAGFAAYLWSNGESTRTIQVSPAADTLYSVAVTGIGGCTGTASETVMVNALPQPSIGPAAPVLCVGESVTLDAGAGWASVLWSTGETTQAITVTPAASAVYQVTVSNASGCQASTGASVTVHVLPSPPAITDRAICAGESTPLDLSGQGWASVEWSTGEIGDSIQVSPATTTTYGVTGTDANGCSASATVTVTVHALPVLAVTPPASALCAGEAVTLDAGPGHATYLWSTGDTGRTIRVEPAATADYTVTVTSLEGCSTSATVTVLIHPLPPADAGPDLATCPGVPVTLGVAANPGQPPLVYDWQPAIGLSDPHAPQPQVTVTADVTYTLTVVNPATGCRSTSQVTVFVPSSLPLTLGNVLRLIRVGGDVVHSWAASPRAQSYEVLWSADKTQAPVTSVGVAGSGAPQLIEPSAVQADSLLHYYQVFGGDCPPLEAP